MYERFIFTGNIEAFSSGRLDIWTDGIKAWLKKPFLGYGFGNFSSAVIGIFRSAHNIYLQILVELGIPGLIVLLLALFKSSNLNLVSALGRGANAALFGIVALSFGLGTFNYDYFWMTLVFTAIVARFERVNS